LCSVSVEAPLLHALGIYALTLPFGYWLVSRSFPEDRLPWREWLIMAALVGIWPLTALAMLLVKLDRD